MVEVLAPSRSVPVSVPPSVPVPVALLRVIVVLVPVKTGTPPLPCASTTTLKGVPATGLTPPLTETTANAPVAVAVKVTGLPVRPVELAVTV